MRSAALYLLLLISVVSPVHAGAQAAPTDREYAVWSDLLEGYLGNTNLTRMVVADTTVQGDSQGGAGPFERRARTARRFDPLPEDVLRSFAEANAARWTLEPGRLHADVPVQLVSEAGPRTLPAEGDRRAWRNLRDGGYPGSAGIISLSRVGFSGDGQTALVFLDVYCGGRCAIEVYFVLVLRENGHWMLNRLYITRQEL